MLEFLICCCCSADGPLRILIFSVSFRFHFGTQRGHNQMILFFFKSNVTILLFSFLNIIILLHLLIRKFNLSKKRRRRRANIFITEKYDNFVSSLFMVKKNCTALALGEYFISYYYCFFQQTPLGHNAG